MEQEFKLIKKTKKYLEGLGYSSANIFLEHLYVKSNLQKLIDIVVKNNDDNLIVVEIRNTTNPVWDNLNEASFHPVVRKLQRYASDINSKYFVLSDGDKHLSLIHI